MIARPCLSCAAAALIAVAAVAGGTAPAGAVDQLPVLRLGNQQDCCDELTPANPRQDCPPYLVPPLYLPPPRTPAREPKAPPPVSDEPIGEMVPIKRADPKPEAESTVAEPSDLGDIFSDERTDRLNKLNSLLDTLQDRLRESVPPLEFQDTADPSIEEGTTASTEPADDPADQSEMPTPPAAPEGESPDASEQSLADVPSDSSPSLDPPGQPETTDPPAAALIQQTEPVAVADPAVPSELSSPTGKAVQHPAAWISQTAVDAPVDRLALADNLYAAGETTTAFNIYREINTQTLADDDRLWVQLQLASCHRRLGNDEEASKYYRMLVNVQDPAWMAEAARWWLMVLDKRKSMVRQSSELETIIQQVREQVRAEPRR